MGHRLTAVVCLVSFLPFASGCVIHQTKNLDPASVTQKDSTSISAVLLKSGRRIQFSPSATLNGSIIVTSGQWTAWDTVLLERSRVRSISGKPETKWRTVKTVDGEVYQARGTITETPTQIHFWGGLKGSGGPQQTFRVPPSDILRTRVEAKRRSITTRDGAEYVVTKTLSQTPEAFEFEGRTAQLSVPVSEVDQVVVRRVDGAKSSVMTILGIGVVVAALGLIALASSCPFVYSFDGERYVLDAEPYGGSVTRGLQRTDFALLEHLRESGGKYHLRVANELDETQNTDELRLIVVDHPLGTRVAPDVAGRMRAFRHPVGPVSARDRTGRDILDLLESNDWAYWHSRMDDAAAAWGEDGKEELLIEFEKPRGAKTARLLFGGCNTLWASRMLKHQLELSGSELPQRYQRIDSSPLVRQALEAWNTREELYRLNLRVGTPDGWQTRGQILGGGPFVPEERTYVFDISDVEGDRLSLRLTPAAGFWMIGSLAIEYDDEPEVRMQELVATAAVDQSGDDIRAALSESDGAYFSMPRTGQYADVSFTAIPTRPGYARSFALKAAGYYEIHLPAGGEPRRDILERYLREPGFAPRYSIEQYRREAEKTQPSR